MYDIIIVGGGPGGSMAGKLLAEKGFKCLLLESAHFPRDKPCGGAITSKALQRFPFLKSLIDYSCYKGIMHGAEPDQIFTSPPNELLAYYSRRIILDAGLLDLARKAGVEIKEGIRVTKIQECPDKVNVECNRNEKFEAKIVIGADGVNSVVRNSTELKNEWKNVKLALVLTYEVPVAEDIMSDFYHKEPPSHVHFMYGGKEGYGWIFAKKQSINFGYGGAITAITGPEVSSLFKQYLQQCIDEKLCPPLTIPKPNGSLLCMSGPIKKFATNRVFLVGDAAGFVHPMSGEGIFYALYSSEILVKNLCMHLQNEKIPLEKVKLLYTNEINRSFGNELRSMGHSSEAAKNLLNFIMNIAIRDTKMVKLIFQLNAAEVAFDKLKWRIVWRVLVGILTGKTRKGKGKK